MKARVYVSFKQTVLDPQGQTIRAALRGMGYGDIEEVRQGKYFEIALSSEKERRVIQQQVEEIAREVLANPVIEEYRVEFLD
jgi:phosphoribosylformylglycinamidine synthase